MRSHRDHSVSPKVHRMESISIFPCIDEKFFWLVFNQIGHIRKGCTLFDPNDIWVFYQTKHGFRRHFHNNASRNIVDNNGKIRCIRNCFKVLIHSFLRWFVVVRDDSQSCCKATKSIYFFHELNRVASFIGSDTSDQRNSTIDNLLNGRKELQFLIVGQSWTFCSRSS